MHNLEQSITEWRRTMMTAPNVSPETLDELENHLRETVEELAGSGMSGPEAFQQAVNLLGPPDKVAAEFEKLAPPDPAQQPAPPAAPQPGTIQPVIPPVAAPPGVRTPAPLPRQ